MAFLVRDEGDWVIDFRGFISPNKLVESDPINLVFVNNGTGSNVERYLDNLHLSVWLPPTRWRRHGNRPSTQLWAYLDNTQHGGTAAWHLPTLEMAVGPYLRGNRMHIRLYESPVRDTADSWHQPGLGAWSIAAAHLEHWSPTLTHLVHGWKPAQELVERWFAGAPGVVRVHRQALGNEGWYQGYWHDGVATFVELQ